eukprot:m51a1_g2414 hypothetical protein (138) ;mRNA; r:797751-798283
MQAEETAQPALTDTVLIVQNKTTHEIPVSLERTTVGELRAAVEAKTNVPCPLQKLILRGVILKDDGAKLSAAGLTQRCKVLLVGSSITEVVDANTRPPAGPESSASAVAQGPAFDQDKPQHKASRALDCESIDSSRE